jgi:hypothetical protein
VRRHALNLIRFQDREQPFCGICISHVAIKPKVGVPPLSSAMTPRRRGAAARG